MKAWLGLLLLIWSALAGAETWRFAIVGDTPYSNYERQQFPKMLETIAEAQVDLVAHIGDIKSGGDRCDDSLFEDRKALFNASRVPFVYVAGDNEWTDCHRVSNGSYDPEERLAKLRSLFWSSDRSLGQKQIALEQQPGYPEQARFRLGPVLFVTLNVPGSDNNWGMTDTPRSEFTARNPAVLAWVREGFAIARQEKLAGIVLLMQANPDFKSFARGLGNRAFRSLLETLRSETLDFPGPVLLVHGDTHHHQIDHPLRNPEGETIERFTRVESYGYPFMGWVKVYIDTDSPGLFRFESHPWRGR
ncbi:MAG TPA: metallophosphoesterase family protein [Rhodocyclaceae bacterium]|nr:metallophosphoesterase family protein [Rhodocyclaceae bacterium]